MGWVALVVLKSRSQWGENTPKSYGMGLSPPHMENVYTFVTFYTKDFPSVWLSNSTLTLIQALTYM